jgi:branched-chain amino acid transport system ATP-binding protein
MLAIHDLVKTFGGARVLDGVSLDVAAGSITGLIGPNGAGKTTLFNIVAGAIRPSSGTVTFDRQPIDGLRPDQIAALGIGRTFQIPRPFGAMSVLENAMLAAPEQTGERFWRNWLPSAGIALQERASRAQAMEWLAFLDLAPLAHAAARTLSGGQRKLLELARVMMRSPRLVLLDEPGAGVNPALLETIVGRIGQLNGRGVTFLLIEHNMDLVAALCRPVHVLATGRVLTSGPPDDVRRDPRVIDAYLGVEAT